MGYHKLILFPHRASAQKNNQLHIDNVLSGSCPKDKKERNRLLNFQNQRGINKVKLAGDTISGRFRVRFPGIPEHIQNNFRAWRFDQFIQSCN